MGSGSERLAQATGPAKTKRQAPSASPGVPAQAGTQGRSANGLSRSTDMDHKSDQANRAISTGRLNASPRLHPRPINVVVFHGSLGSSRFKEGFPLRCLQRLSRPHIATLHCGWRHNRSTRGASIPVLSY